MRPRHGQRVGDDLGRGRGAGHGYAERGVSAKRCPLVRLDSLTPPRLAGYHLERAAMIGGQTQSTSHTPLRVQPTCHHQPARSPRRRPSETVSQMVHTRGRHNGRLVLMSPFGPCRLVRHLGHRSSALPPSPCDHDHMTHLTSVTSPVRTHTPSWTSCAHRRTRAILTAPHIH